MALIFRAPAKVAQRVLRDNFRAPAKVAQRVLRDNFRAPAKIAQRVLRDNFRAPAQMRSKCVGRRRRRRKRKQLELPQAVSKCALRRRGGDNRTPPKPLKGSPRRSFGFYLFLAEVSPLRSFGALLQAYIPCIQPSREPTADSGFSLIPALSAAVGPRPFRTKQRAPTMALIFLVEMFHPNPNLIPR